MEKTKIIWIIALLFVANVNADTIMVVSHISPELILTFYSSPELTFFSKPVEEEVPEAPPGDGTITEDLTPYIEEEIEERIQEQSLFHYLLSKFSVFVGTTIGMIVLGILGFVLVVGQKTVVIDNREATYKEKLIFYLARPYKIFGDTKEILMTKKQREKLKKDFKESV